MKYSLSLRRGAMEDMALAEAYYESERPGLSLRFRNEVAEVLRRVEGNPELFPLSTKPPCRKANLAIFPFSIFYVVVDAKIIVIAVHDTRRNPGRWQRRLKP